MIYVYRDNLYQLSKIWLDHHNIYQFLIIHYLSKIREKRGLQKRIYTFIPRDCGICGDIHVAKNKESDSSEGI